MAPTPRLWLCTWSPGAMGAVAKPMTWPYLCTASPLATARSATLCPDGTRRETRTSPCDVRTRMPGGSGMRATATSSLGCRCTATSARSAMRVVAVGVTFTRPDVVIVSFPPPKQGPGLALQSHVLVESIGGHSSGQAVQLDDLPRTVVPSAPRPVVTPCTHLDGDAVVIDQDVLAQARAGAILVELLPPIIVFGGWRRPL